METEEIKKVIGDLGTAFEAYKAANDRALAEVKKKGAEDVVTTEKVARIDAALTSFEDTKTALEARADELETKFNRSALISSENAEALASEVKAFNNQRRELKTFAGAPAVTAEEYTEYKKVFLNALRKGDQHVLSGEERKALQVGVDSDGGYVVPAAVSARIVTRLFETSAVRPLVSIETIGTDALEGLRDTDAATAGGWVTETGTRSETATPTLGKWRIPVHEMYAEPRATQQLLDDATMDMEAWLSNKVADILTRTENTSFVTGTGVGQPRGFCSYTTAATADATRTWGQLEHVVTGANGAFATSNPADKLFDLEVAFKPGYLQNAKIATRRSVITLLRKIKDGNGQYVWQPSLVAGVPQTVIGYSVVLLEDMPALTTDSLSLAMGDFKQAYTIVDRQGFRVLRDNLTAKPYVKFYTTRRVGGGVLQFEALKFLKFAA